METRSGNPCDYMLDCLIGDATDEERRAFEAHLSDCPSCLKQWNELTEVWNALPDLANEAEPPKELKRQVMDAIFGAQGEDGGERQASVAPAESSSAPRPASDGSGRRTRRFARLRGFAYAAAVIVVALSVWVYASRFDSSNVANAVDEPLYVEQTYALSAFDKSMAEAKGTGWIVCQGKKRKLVLNVSGLAKTDNGQAYQVWLIRNGKRSNAGTFWVDPKGSGVFIYELPPSDMQFDAIGITLEPDSKGKEPRGTKVLGT